MSQNLEMMQPEPLRPISEDEVESFWREGVVCLRQVMPQDWLDSMAEPVEASLAAPEMTDLSAMGDDLERLAGAVRTVDPTVLRSADARGHFHAGTDHWRDIAAFGDFATRSPLGPMVAALLRSERVYFYEDSVLVKDPGTEERTAFHQDMAYFHLDGDQVCTSWVPLDPVDAVSGAVRYVIGSHRDRTRYRPNMFVTTMALAGTEGKDVPDYHQQVGAASIVSFDTKPGDVIVHHARTIHGAYANASATQRRRAISVRYAGDDTVFSPVPGGLPKPHHANMVAGQPLDTESCPLAWPRP